MMSAVWLIEQGGIKRETTIEWACAVLPIEPVALNHEQDVALHPFYNWIYSHSQINQP